MEELGRLSPEERAERREGRQEKRGQMIRRRQGKRLRKRLNWKKDAAGVTKITNKVKRMLNTNGDAAETKFGIIAVPNGIVPHIIEMNGYQIVIMAPAAALDEAIARFERPDEPAQDPTVDLTDISDSLVDDGDVTSGDPLLPKISEAYYEALGCAACTAHGVTMADVADELSGFIPAIIKAGRRAIEEVSNIVRRDAAEPPDESFRPAVADGEASWGD